MPRPAFRRLAALARLPPPDTPAVTAADTRSYAMNTRNAARLSLVAMLGLALPGPALAQSSVGGPAKQSAVGGPTKQTSPVVPPPHGTGTTTPPTPQGGTKTKPPK
jgi:hypothetical protein